MCVTTVSCLFLQNVRNNYVLSILTKMCVTIVSCLFLQNVRNNEMHNVLGCKLRHTTTYRLRCNGMVERFHRSLKAALKARLLGRCWMDELPVVLLEISLNLKRGPWGNTSSSNLRTNPRISSYLLPPAPPPPLPHLKKKKKKRNSLGSDIVRKLQGTFNRWSSLNSVHHGPSKSYAPRDLKPMEPVTVLHDVHRGPLVRPYNEHFKVLADQINISIFWGAMNP